MEILPDMTGELRTHTLLALLYFVLAGSLVFAAFFSPQWVAQFISSDNELGYHSVARIQALRIFCLVIGLGCIVFIRQLKKLEPDQGISIQWYLSEIDRDPHRFLLGLLLVAGISFGALYIFYALGSWQSVTGAEYMNVAGSIASGNGLSVLDGNRWMWFDFDYERSAAEQPSGQWYPSAMIDPIYPAVLGWFLRMFGDEGKLAIVILHIGAWLGTCYLVYALGRITFGPAPAILGALCILVWPSAFNIHTKWLSPAPFAAFFIVLIAYLSVKLLKTRSVHREVLLGVILGLSSLTQASLLSLIPIVAVVPLLNGWRDFSNWKSMFRILLVSVLIISPWSVRNYMLFDEFIPVRVGMGLFAHQGNPVLASTYLENQQACSSTVAGEMWQASGARQALDLARGKNATMIYRRSFDCVELLAPDGYESMNEPQRDAVYSNLAYQFVVAHPLAFIDLAFHKFLRFFEGWRLEHTLTGGLGLLGVLLSLRSKEGLILAAIIGIYVLPYAIGVPWSYRYRYPIEPLLLLMTFQLVNCCIGWLRARLRGTALTA